MPEKLVATTLAMPEPPPLHGTSAYDGPVSWVISAAGAVIAAVFWLRRKAHRDNTEITKDKAESNLVRTLIEERDRAMNEAREAWARRTKDAEQIATLHAENGHLKQDMERLERRFHDLQLRFDMVLSAINAIKPDFRLPPIPSTAL